MKAKRKVALIAVTVLILATLVYAFLPKPVAVDAVPVIRGALLAARAAFQRGVRDAEKLRRLVWQTISITPLARIDYVEIVHADSLELIEHVNGRAVIAAAVFFGNTRLIDNIQLS